MANSTYFFNSGVLFGILNESGRVELGHIDDVSVLPVFEVCDRIQNCVVLRILIPSAIRHPHIIAFISQNECVRLVPAIDHPRIARIHESVQHEDRRPALTL